MRLPFVGWESLRFRQGPISGRPRTAQKTPTKRDFSFGNRVFLLALGVYPAVTLADTR